MSKQKTVKIEGSIKNPSKPPTMAQLRKMAKQQEQKKKKK